MCVFSPHTVQMKQDTDMHTTLWYNVVGMVCAYVKREKGLDVTAYEYDSVVRQYRAVADVKPYEPYWIQLEADQLHFVREAFTYNAYNFVKSNVVNDIYLEEEFVGGTFAANTYTANDIVFSMESEPSWDGGLRPYYDLRGITNTEKENTGWGITPYISRGNGTVVMRVSVDTPIVFRMCSLQLDGCYELNLPSNDRSRLVGYLKREYRQKLFQITVKLDGNVTKDVMVMEMERYTNQSSGWVPVTDKTYAKEFCTKLISNVPTAVREIEITLEFHDLLRELEELERMGMEMEMEREMGYADTAKQFIDTYYDYDAEVLGDLNTFHPMGFQLIFDNLVYQTVGLTLSAQEKLLEEQSAKLATMEAAIDAQQVKIEEQNNRIDSLTRSAAALDGLNKTLVIEKELLTSEKEKEIVGLHEQMNALADADTENNRLIAGLRTEIAAKDGMVSDGEKVIAGLHDGVKILEESIATKDNEIAGLRTEIAAKDGMVSDGEKVIAEKERLIAEKDEVIAGLRDQVKTLTAENVRKDEEAAERNKVLWETQITNREQRDTLNAIGDTHVEVKYIIYSARREENEYNEEYSQLEFLKGYDYAVMIRMAESIVTVRNYIAYVARNLDWFNGSKRQINNAINALDQYRDYLNEMRDTNGNDRIPYPAWIDAKRSRGETTVDTLYEMVEKIEDTTA